MLQVLSAEGHSNNFAVEKCYRRPGLVDSRKMLTAERSYGIPLQLLQNLSLSQQ